MVVEAPHFRRRETVSLRGEGGGVILIHWKVCVCVCVCVYLCPWRVEW